MIAFDFSYYQPTSVEEAITLYKDLRGNEQSVCYFSGGTEVISRARRNEINCDAIIDIKNIPGTNQLEWQDDQLIIGSSCTLSSLVNDQSFPLLSEVSKKIATQTERNKITIGGNIASTLPYKEAIMPFLLADSDVVIASEKGTTKQSINDIYQKGRLLKEGEFIVQIKTNRYWTTLPFVHSRKTKQSQINYPIVSLAALQDGNDTRLALSGLIDYPFRSKKMEALLQSDEENMENIMDNVLEYVPETPLSDLQASEKYRLFVLRSVLGDVLTMKGAS